MNWQKDKLTIIGFGIIFIILGIFGYILWNITREPMAEIPVLDTPVVTDISKPEQQVPNSTPEKTEKDKVKIYTEKVKVDESGDNWDIKVLRTINNSNPELLTTLELRDALVGQFVPYNVTLSPDRKNLLIWYEDAYDGSGSGSDKLQLFNLETKETRDILVSKSGFNIEYPIFSPNSKEVFFLRSKSNNKDKIYDFYLYNVESQKNEIIKTVKTRSGIFNPRWLPENKILLSYSLETTIENPSFRQEFYIFNKDDKTISAFPNQNFSLLSEGNYDIFNSDNTLFTKAKTFTTRGFKTCYGEDDTTVLPNSYSILETLSGKEISSFKGNPEEPMTPISFSPDNKEILYRLDSNACFISIDENQAKYYVQSLYDNKPREEVKLDDIIKKWDIAFNSYTFAKREIIYYQ
jgi:hypothetical protein